MVQRGQFLERPVLIPVRDGLVLEGMSHRGERAPGLLILPPADDGGGMDHVVAAELAWAVSSAGHPTLRFNYRGVGASQGTVGDGSARLEDAHAAFRQASENVKQDGVVALAIGASASTLLLLAEQLGPALRGAAFVSPRGVVARDFTSVPEGALVVIGQAETAFERPELSDVLSRRDGVLEIIPGADAAFVRNLTAVGTAVVGWMGTPAAAR